MKFLIVSDIHLGPRVIPGANGDAREIRQANDFAKEALEEMIPYWNALDCDAIFHLGDSIRDVAQPEEDKQNARTVFQLLNTSSLPVIHLVGNHDMHVFNQAEIEALWAETGSPQSVFGTRQFGELTVIWLDFVVTQAGKMLSAERLAWLEVQLNQAKRALILLHYPIELQSIEGSVYFRGEEGKRMSQYQNAKEIRQLLSKYLGKVVATISGHVHWLGLNQLYGWHQITVPAFTEKILGMEQAFHPKVYSTVEVHTEKITWKSYSGEWCFSTIELERRDG